MTEIRGYGKTVSKLVLNKTITKGLIAVIISFVVLESMLVGVFVIALSSEPILQPLTAPSETSSARYSNPNPNNYSSRGDFNYIR